MEVVWTRAFTFVLQTTIYAFAAILTTYLLATWFGSLLYRRHLANRSTITIPNLLGFLCLFALLPVVFDDPRLQRNPILTLASIVPICAALGYMTSKLIDEYSHGRPASAGRSYGWNIAGGILGPLVAAYLLLPLIGVRAALALLATPFIGLYIWSAGGSLTRLPQQIMLATAIGLLGVSILISRSFEDGAFYDGPHQETGPRGDGDRCGQWHGQGTAGQRDRDNVPDTDHKGDGAFAPSPKRPCRERIGDLLWDGDNRESDA
jgi:hypothetical protein